ncbi:GNAT family N-acetyltransferase [Gulbenkiania mobilis]|uniref:Phosphinothricin acetyltransferase n=1 Tax=Gulbenkiania mobilis TaxID=397457 RepID=A0ABY2D0V7_GULMO|nr:phosphinothricin acetyltransferase [Gulbenkiania mobilis]
MQIVPMQASHWPQVRAIYQTAMQHGGATFETEPPADWLAFASGRLKTGRLVAVEGARVLGWTALTPYSSRSVYRGVAELSIYLAADAQGQGLGSRLMEALVLASEAEGFWTLLAGIFPDNVASCRLHERHGFRKVGVRERMGRHPLSGRWLDVLLYERRSLLTGR